MLTYQNHGGYNQNDSSLDTVHSLTDYGDLTDQVNEYLTSVSMSADAFVELTEYFKTIDRPVIVCMLGDHVPAIIPGMEPKTSLSTDEALLFKQAVPYVMWTNYNIKYDGETSWASVIDIMPMIKKMAGVPLSIYDQMILKRHESVPVFMASGLCRNVDGEFFVYNSQDERNETRLISQYLFAEYNLLSAGRDFREELFEVDQ